MRSINIKVDQPYRCWWQMFVARSFDDNYGMSVTVLIIWVTNIHYIFIVTSSMNIQNKSATLHSVNNIENLSAASSHQHHRHRLWVKSNVVKTWLRDIISWPNKLRNKMHFVTSVCVQRYVDRRLRWSRTYLLRTFNASRLWVKMNLNGLNPIWNPIFLNRRDHENVATYIYHVFFIIVISYKTK